MDHRLVVGTAVLLGLFSSRIRQFSCVCMALYAARRSGEILYCIYCSSNAQLVADVGCLGSVLFDFIEISLSLKKKKKSLTET